MSHATRARRKLNALHRRNAAIRQQPVPRAEQQKRAAANAHDKHRRYPYPPNYRYEQTGALPTQPLCYGSILGGL